MFYSILNKVNIDWGSGDGTTSNNSKSTIIEMMNSFLAHYKTFVIGFLGLADLTMVLIFVWLLYCLASGTTNFAQKNTNTRRLLIWCVCMACLGALNLILALVYSSFK